VILSGIVTAQNQTNSPYTRYGYGDLSPQTFGKSKGMGGVAYGLRDGYQINAANPASYTMVDSLTFLFDAGVSLQNTNLSDGKTKQNIGNSGFDYVAVQFRLHPKLSMALGLLPYSNVGYSFSQGNADDPDNIYYKTYSGEGGFHQAFLGLGFKVSKNLSVGMNASYLWGDITRQNHVGFADAGKYEEWRINTLSVKDFKFDIGVQYTRSINKKNDITFGAIFSPKNKLKNDAYLQTQTALRSSSSEYTDSNITTTNLDKTCELPMSIGAGIAYQYDKRLTVAADYSFQQWSDVVYMDEKSFYDMHKMAVGLEYLPSLMGRSYFSHIKFRIGGYFSTPYYKVQDLATKEYYRASGEYGVTAGFALPLPHTRSLLSISAQYVNVTGKRAMLNEKYMRLCIGMTFNERWFFKRKVD
jgi:hypothetical protein